MKILVLGGGQQGRVIATDLARALERATVTVADVRAPRLPALPNLRWVEADLAEPAVLERRIAEHDLAVGALPSRLGLACMRAAIAARRRLVDVSFSAESPLALDGEARAAGVTVLPDCGLAPGLSHLVVGHAVATGPRPDEVVIDVGGVARDPGRPFGYVVTWSLDDLLEEYVRPARIVRGGRPATAPVFSGLENVEIPGVGTMEAFLSDGLRTLVETHPEIPDMCERTLRWPGHVEAVRPLVDSGRFVETIRARCSADPPDDLVVLRITVRRGAGVSRALLVDRYDAATGLTAMARTTAFTTAAVALAVASGLPVPPGVVPLERAAAVPGFFAFVRDALARRGVRLGDLEPVATAR
uniref:Saccharopine dehydrogenase n=1 Tax=Eiseniibacteriota bacterium TaxID=2212470 RepID=A0A832MJ15_UNCEI